MASEKVVLTIELIGDATEVLEANSYEELVVPVRQFVAELLLLDEFDESVEGSCCDVFFGFQPNWQELKSILEYAEVGKAKLTRTRTYA